MKEICKIQIIKLYTYSTNSIIATCYIKIFKIIIMLNFKFKKQNSIHLIFLTNLN